MAFEETKDVEDVAVEVDHNTGLNSEGALFRDQYVSGEDVWTIDDGQVATQGAADFGDGFGGQVDGDGGREGVRGRR